MSLRKLLNNFFHPFRHVRSGSMSFSLPPLFTMAEWFSMVCLPKLPSVVRNNAPTFPMWQTNVPALHYKNMSQFFSVVFCR